MFLIFILSLCGLCSVLRAVSGDRLPVWRPILAPHHLHSARESANATLVMPHRSVRVSHATRNGLAHPRTPSDLHIAPHNATHTTREAPPTETRGCSCRVRLTCATILERRRFPRRSEACSAPRAPLSLSMSAPACAAARQAPFVDQRIRSPPLLAAAALRRRRRQRRARYAGDGRAMPATGALCRRRARYAVDGRPQSPLSTGGHHRGRLRSAAVGCGRLRSAAVGCDRLRSAAVGCGRLASTLCCQAMVIHSHRYRPPPLSTATAIDRHRCRRPPLSTAVRRPACAVGRPNPTLSPLALRGGRALAVARRAAALVGPWARPRLLPRR